MKVRYVTFCFIAFWISACTWAVPGKKATAIAKDTLGYSYTTLKERAADCGSKPDSDCTVFKIKYPVFAGQQVLNDSVKNKLLYMFIFGDKPDTGLQQLDKHFMNDYKSLKQDPKNPMFYTLDGYAKVLRQDSGLTTMELGSYSFEGGAHPVYFTYFINWDTKLDKNISLNDLFNPGYGDKLKNIGEAIFRKNEKLSDTASLATNYFFTKNKFTLNNNYSITPLGIRFLYNIYEVKPFSAGTTDLFIPYTQIKSLLKPNSVVAQYLK
jgi:hypothetical protein